MKFRGAVISLAATGALLAGGCSGGAESAPDNANIERSFKASQEYWESMGVAAVGGVKLITVAEGGVPCGDTTVTAESISPVTYCPGIKTIVVSPKTYEQKEKSAKNANIAPEAVAIGHELGHAVVKSEYVQASETTEEHIADCLAGVVIAATAPELRKGAKAFLGTLGSDQHGSSEKRQMYFDYGCEGDKNTCIGIAYGIMPNS